jgi:hypothetical protein
MFLVRKKKDACSSNNLSKVKKYGCPNKIKGNVFSTAMGQASITITFAV